MPEWIRRCLDEDEPLVLNSMSTSKSLLIQTTLFPAQEYATKVTSLIDSGCSGRAFADSRLVQSLRIKTQKLPRPRQLLLADGKPSDTITDFFIAPIAMGLHREEWIFFVTSLADTTPLIFGLPWLKCHNPLINWSSMELAFNSQYCRYHCYPTTSPPHHTLFAPTIPDPPSQGDHATFSPQPTQLTSISSEYRSPTVEDINEDSNESIPVRTPTRYRPPTIEDYDEPKFEQLGAKELRVETTLTPGSDHYRTYAPNNSTAPEYRARMIPNRPSVRPRPILKVAGRRHATPLPRKLPLPPLSVPIPQALASPLLLNDRPDISDIRMVRATNFLQFCRAPGVDAIRITWDEIYQDDKQLPGQSTPLPDISEDEFRRILEGEGDHLNARSLFPETVHDFIDECYQPLRLNRITDSDIEKFLKGKPEQTREDISAKLPDWLRDMVTAFLPRLADELPPRRAWDHKIELIPATEPPYLKNRPLSPRELQVVRKWLDDNLSKGFIRESRARCAAPLLLAAKPGGGVRICQDYRGLNNVTIKNRYPLPLIRETLDALCHAKYYTKLDIIAAFNKLRIAEGHEWKTAFITRFGLFESLVMPFGLCNAPASFQHYINHTLYDLLDKICTAYLDDVLVYSQTRKEHRNHVRQVVQRLLDAGLQIDIDKCEFETTRTRYLGLIITSDGIQMDPTKVSTIVEWRDPESIKDLQRFLGFANFYRRFIRDFSQICLPLNTLLKKATTWTWEDSQKQAFIRLKAAFSTAPVLAFFDYNRKTVLETDASDWASGGVLSQYDDNNHLRPVAYFSSKHSAQECNYKIYDKELLAIIKALEEWRPELQGSQEEFEIITDHKNLEYFTTTKALSQRQVRWSEFLSQYNFRIVYRPGSKAVRPDALSRRREDRPASVDANDDRIKNRQRTVLPAERFDAKAFADLLGDHNNDNDVDMTAAPMSMVIPDLDKPIDEILDKAYENSDIAQRMLTALRDPAVRRWPREIRKELRIAMQDCQVHENKIYYREKLYIPPDDELKIHVIYRTHSSGPGGHPGRVKTIDLVSRTYWWPRMHHDIADFVKACELCMRTKASRSAPPGFLKPLPVPFRAWSDISVDYITPLPDCARHGSIYKHILVIVCRLTKMRHFISTRTLNADELADAFIRKVYTLHGAPDNIISDRGTQFVSQFWKHLSERLGIELKHSSAFHPQTDGQTERVNAGVEQYLRQFMNFHQDDWVDWLPLAEFSANNVVSETTGVSPFFANYGFHPRLGTEPTDPCPPNLSLTQKRQFYKANTVADRFQRIIDQLQALAKQSVQRYEDNANESRSESPRFYEGQKVYVDTRNMRTNRPMKKGDDKWDGPYTILKVYPRACFLELPNCLRIFPVFHHSLLRPYNGNPSQPQRLINEAERRNVRGRVLERDDDTDEVIEKWEFERILDCHNDYGDGNHYSVKWKHHAPTWQPAKDLKGQDEALWEFHRQNPNKPGPPAWVRRPRELATETPTPGPRRSTRLQSVSTAQKSVRFATTTLVRVFDKSAPVAWNRFV